MNKWESILNDKDKLASYSRNLFKKVDSDSSGYVDIKELRGLLNTLSDEVGIQVYHNFYE